LQVEFSRTIGKNPKASIFPYPRNGWINMPPIDRPEFQTKKKYLYTFSGYGNRIVSVDRPINGLDWAQVLLYQFVREETPKKAPKWPAVLAQ
jgi:hypothetical protein